VAERRSRRAVASRSAPSRWLIPAAAEGAGLALLATSLLAALALLAHGSPVPGGPSAFAGGGDAEPAGPAGSALAGLLLGGLGGGAWVAVGIAGVLGGRLLLGRGLPPATSRFWVGAALLLLAVPAGAACLEQLGHQGWMLRGWTQEGGGSVGSALAGAETRLLGPWGALLVNGLLGVVGGLGILGIPAGRAADFAAGAAVAGGQATAALTARATRATTRALRLAALAGLALAGRGVDGARALGRRGAEAARGLQVWRERRARRARVAAREIEIAGDEPLAETAADPPSGQRRARRGAAPDIVDHRSRREPTPQQEAFTFDETGAQGPYRLPEASVFDPPPPGRRGFDRESLIMNSRILEKKLGDFGVNGRVVTVHPGPVVTMYEYEPASGVKVNRIVGLTDDLALALRALSVRIIAPLPGKSVVGIEVANAEREVVNLREVLESDELRRSRSRLSVALGKDIFGNPVVTDLARMPHLLVAGATGTGKSVFLNSLLCSILFRATPDDLKLLLIDPKLLELSVYEGIPHLLADVVTNPKRAAAALHGVVHKMEERYRWMQALAVRSIDQFNARVEELRAEGRTSFQLRAKPGEEEGEEVELRRLPYILVVIDELADLMVVSARDVEEALQRLAQMARAAGIHLVLATQRPSVDVLTGIIKANFPARISFQVSSRTDSRTILDQNGAEVLLGQGDMLFLPPGTSKMQRVHGSFVSEKEVTRLVDFLRSQGRPQFDETLIRLKEESEARESRPEGVDDMYDRAIEIVAESRNASISYLQRRLKVGYNRAARMIEQMEIDGIVGPQEGPKGREVLVRPLELE